MCSPGPIPHTADVPSNLANIQLRYELFPYYYSLAYRAWLDGEPVFPSLDYYWPQVISGARSEAEAQQVRLVVRGSSYDAEDNRRQVHLEPAAQARRVELRVRVVPADAGRVRPAVGVDEAVVTVRGALVGSACGQPQWRYAAFWARWLSLGGYG